MPQQRWNQPMDYFNMGQQMVEPIAAEMKQRRAGRVASALMESGDYNSPDMGDPMVQRAVAGMFNAKHASEINPLELQMRQFKMGMAVNDAAREAEMHPLKMERERANIDYYKRRGTSSGYTGKKYIGDVGNVMQLQQDETDAQEELAEIQMNPDPDPTTQAMLLNRAQNNLDSIKTIRALALKKIEKSGVGTGTKVTVRTDPKTGAPITTMTGTPDDPSLQRFMFPDSEKFEGMDEAGLTGAMTAHQKQAGWLGGTTPKKDEQDTYRSQLGETRAQEAARLAATMQGIQQMLAKKQAPQTVAQSMEQAPAGGSPEDVRAAFRAGKITREQAKAALSQFGFQ